jgi:pimeloyl-ACP methyl ester carboxylesterase
MGSTAYWQSGEARELAAGRRLIFVDLLGFGRSPWPDSRYTIEDQVSALRRTLVKRGANRKITLVAHSFGTIVATHYAARFPDDVDQIFLFGVPLYRSSEEARARVKAMSPMAGLIVRSPMVARGVCAFHNAVMPLASRIAPRLRPDLPHAVAHDGALHFWPSLFGSVNTVITEPIQTALKQVGPKATIILGERDRISDIEFVESVTRVSGAHLVRTANDHSNYWHTFPDILLRQLPPVTGPTTRTDE